MSGQSLSASAVRAVRRVHALSPAPPSAAPLRLSSWGGGGDGEAQHRLLCYAKRSSPQRVAPPPRMRLLSLQRASHRASDKLVSIRSCEDELAASWMTWRRPERRGVPAVLHLPRCVIATRRAPSRPHHTTAARGAAHCLLGRSLFCQGSTFVCMEHVDGASGCRRAKARGPRLRGR